jgi:hypothetical protein
MSLAAETTGLLSRISYNFSISKFLFRALWVSTGMVPQCIYIKLKQKMSIKQVCLIFCVTSPVLSLMLVLKVEIEAPGVKKMIIKLSDGFRDLIPGTQMSSTAK